LKGVLYKAIGKRLSPAGADARLSILIYHRVRPVPDALFPHEPTTESFDCQIKLLKSAFNVLPLSEAVERLKKKTLPARAASITFDDGYADNATHALPILRKHGLIATFFIATGYLNGGRMFNDTVIEAFRRSEHRKIDLSDLGLGIHDLTTLHAKHSAIISVLSKLKYLPVRERDATALRVKELSECPALPDDLMMSTKQLRTLYENGMEVGAHTERHPILAKCSLDEARSEIERGRGWLQQTLSTGISLFAYPNGKPLVDYLPEQAELVRELGFAAAVSTAPGFTSATTDIFNLPRFTPWGGQQAFVPRLLNNLRCR
jgi:peptidoglycan/xylan/chitin deacetylase (PgdA/CDA1 family)